MSKNGKLIFKNFDPYVTSAFGWRLSPINGKLEFHNGTDYGTHVKKIPQYPIEEGFIKSCGIDSSGAKLIYVQYDRLGYIGLHYHLDTINVKVGQKVNAKTLLGTTGETGMSKGIHLHYSWFKISEWSKPFNKRIYENFEKYNYVPFVEKSKYKIGDKIKIIAKGNGSSDGKAGDCFGIGWERFVKNIYPNKPFPYQIGNFEGTTGFYAEKSLEPITTSQTINVGDSVVVNGYGSVSSDGIGNKTREYKNHKMKVIAILKNSKNGYLLNQHNSGKVGNFRDGTAWFKKEDLKK